MDLSLCVSLAFFYMQNSLAGFVFAKSVREMIDFVYFTFIISESKIAVLQT